MRGQVTLNAKNRLNFSAIPVQKSICHTINNNPRWQGVSLLVSHMAKPQSVFLDNL